MANARSYSSLHSILKNGLDRQPRPRAPDEPAITHPNIRHTRGVPIQEMGPPLAGHADYFH